MFVKNKQYLTVSFWEEDCSMKSLIKLIILAAIIGLTSLTVHNTQAANVHNYRPLIHQQANVVIFFALPQLSSEGGNVIYTNNLISTITENSKPLLNTKNNTADICHSKKGNEVYELTALFNDKLQMLLAFFATPKNPDSLKEVIKDKESIQVVSAALVSPLVN